MLSELRDCRRSVYFEKCPETFARSGRKRRGSGAEINDRFFPNSLGSAEKDIAVESDA